MGGCKCGRAVSSVELMEKTAQQQHYLIQQMPSLDQQKRRMRFLPVQDTQIMRSSWLKARPVGELRQRRAMDLMLCCCMSMTKRLPLPFEDTPSPKAPQSVKKMLPVLFDRIREWGPSKGVPQYSLTNSVSAESAAPSEMIDCLSKSVRQQQFLAWSNTTDLT